jgi:hypothetical protein
MHKYSNEKAPAAASAISKERKRFLEVLGWGC